jgi:hypothetical protein
MSSDPNPHAGAEALAELLRRLEGLRAHLDREVGARTQVGEFRRLRAERPTDSEEFTRLVATARAECILVGLQYDQYGRTLDRVDQLYRRMANCTANPIPDDGAVEVLGQQKAMVAASRVFHEDRRDTVRDYLDLHRDLDGLVKEVSAHHRMRAKGAKPTEGESPTTPPARVVPVWEETARRLLFRGQVCKQFRRPAKNQETVLAAFQEENWPNAIDDPLPDGKLARTVESLNDRLQHIKFNLNGAGTGVSWHTA